jgi:hypothetical protein
MPRSIRVDLPGIAQHAIQREEIGHPRKTTIKTDDLLESRL